MPVILLRSAGGGFVPPDFDDVQQSAVISPKMCVKSMTYGSSSSVAHSTLLIRLLRSLCKPMRFSVILSQSWLRHHIAFVRALARCACIADEVPEQAPTFGAQSSS